MDNITSVLDEKIKELEIHISSLEEMKSALEMFKNKGSKLIQCPYINAFLNNFEKK